MTVDLCFDELYGFYRDHLLSHVMPFWIRRVDWQHGGLNNCVTDEGQPVSSDKYIWSQGRALWTFSALYNRVDRDEEWLRIARHIAQFLLDFGQAEDGRWAYALHKDGSVAIGPQSVYADAFVMMGLTEFARATGEQQAIDLSLQAFDRVSPLLRDHATLPAQPHRIPDGFQAHGPSMIFALAFHELGIETGDNRVLDRSLELAEIVMTEHLKPDRGILFEFVRPGGAVDSSDVGKTFLPGHAIESMWFMEQIYQHHGHQDRIDLAMHAIRWHLEQGWDPEFGGLFLACHTDGGQPQWHGSRQKIWWPHTEALYALLKAYEVTEESWCQEWYSRIHDYSFRKFPNRRHGEWYQNLDRHGAPIDVVVKGLQVKDPFHLPRTLILGMQVLSRLRNRDSPRLCCPFFRAG